MARLPSRLLTLCITLGIACVSIAQTGAGVGSRPAFEAASLKPTAAKEPIIGMLVWPGGRITATNYTLNMFIQEAYRNNYPLQDFQIVGSPRWAGVDRYSLVAVPPVDSKSSKINPSKPQTATA